MQFPVNELLPALLFRHCAVAGLWFGRKHPDMQMFLSKFVDEVEGLATLTWHHDFGTTTPTVTPLCCSAASPARAAVHNQVQFTAILVATCASPKDSTMQVIPQFPSLSELNDVSESISVIFLQGVVLYAHQICRQQQNHIPNNLKSMNAVV